MLRRLQYVRRDCTNNVNLPWPEPGCPCFEAMMCGVDVLALSVDVVFSMASFGGA